MQIVVVKGPIFLNGIVVKTWSDSKKTSGDLIVRLLDVDPRCFDTTLKL